MHIAFDGKRAIQNFTGLGNYSRLLITELGHRDAHMHHWHLYAPRRPNGHPRITEFLSENPHLHLHYAHGWMGHMLPALWRSWGISKELQEDSIDIFHGLSGELPLNIHLHKNIRTVVTIHDLIFLHFPQYYRIPDRNIYTYKFRYACRHADAIVAVSECTKRDIVRFFHIPEDKIHVIYQGCSPSFALRASEDLREKVTQAYALPQNFILNVGTIEERKNIGLAVQALPLLPQDVHLVIVGKSTEYTEKVLQLAQELNLLHRVRILQNVPFSHLPALYQMARAFVYPSRYEGFGIPMLEALSAGTPVVGATGSCLEEAGGPDSLYVSPDSPEELGAALNEILSNAPLARSLSEKGKQYATRFSHGQQAAQRLLKHFSH